MNTGVIDRFTEVFTRYIDSGFGLLGGEVAFLASTLIVLDVTIAGLFWAWGANEDVLAHLIKKTLYVGFFAFLIGNFNGLAKIVFNSFSGLGLKATGSGLSVSQFLQPGRLAQVGIDAGRPILDAAGQLTGYVSFFLNFIQIFVLLIALANAAARIQPSRSGYLNAVQVYPFADGALYQVYAAPGQVTDIALQEGEQLVGSGPVAAGDTVRWIIGATESGTAAAKK